MLRLLGEKIRHLRRLHELTQAGLAQRLALASHAHISNVEAGRRPPSLDLIVRIADVFGASADYLLNDSVPVDLVLEYQGPKENIGEKPKLGAKIRHLRKQHNLTQIELAQKLGLATHAHISFLETGEKEPSIELVLRIAEVFNVPTDNLLRDGIPVELSDEKPNR